MIHINKMVIPMEHKIFNLKLIFVFLSKKMNEAKNNNIMKSIENKPTIPSLTPPFIPLPTNASKHPIIQEKIYFTNFISIHLLNISR